MKFSARLLDVCERLSAELADLPHWKREALRRDEAYLRQRMERIEKEAQG